MRGYGTNALDPGVDASVSLNLDGLQIAEGTAYRRLLRHGADRGVEGAAGLVLRQVPSGGRGLDPHRRPGDEAGSDRPDRLRIRRQGMAQRADPFGAAWRHPGYPPRRDVRPISAVSSRTPPRPTLPPASPWAALPCRAGSAKPTAYMLRGTLVWKPIERFQRAAEGQLHTRQSARLASGTADRLPGRARFRSSSA